MDRDQAALGSSTDVAQALLSGTQQRILSLMLSSPHESFFTTQIIDLVRAGRGGVQRELKRLVGCGILECFDRAHRRHYRLNTQCRVLPALRQILDVPPTMHQPIEQALAQFRDRMRLAVLCASCSDSDETLLGVVSDQLQCIDIEHISSAAPDARVELLNSTEFVDGLRRADPLMVRIATGPHQWVVPGNRRGRIQQ